MADSSAFFGKLITVTGLALLHLQHIQGDMCQMTDKPDTKGNDVEYDDSVVNLGDWNACKDYCLKSSACMAVEVRGTDCFYANHDIQQLPSKGSTLGVKVCTAPGACTWSRRSNTGGSNPVVKLTLTSYTSCERACRLVVSCKAVSFDTLTSACKLYTTATSSVAAAGSILGRRYDCSLGCCYNRFQDTTGGSDQAVTLVLSLSSCEDLCYKLAACTAISFSGSACSIYTKTVETVTETGVTTSLKSCSAGGPPTALSITTVCLTGSTIQPVLYVVVLMSGCAVLMTASGALRH